MCTCKISIVVYYFLGLFRYLLSGPFHPPVLYRLFVQQAICSVKKRNYDMNLNGLRNPGR